MSAQHTAGPWRIETVPTSVGVCHKVGPFPGKREGDAPRHACLYADYPSAGNPRDEDVGLVEGGAGPSDKPVGIVDPFLKGPVQPGQRFWLVVYPRVITSLRHVWCHPAFDDEPATDVMALKSKGISEAWLRDFVSRSDCPGYEEVIAKALNNDDSWDDNYLHFDGSDAHGGIPPEFWDHVEVVTGKKIEKRASYFSCSC